MRSCSLRWNLPVCSLLQPGSFRCHYGRKLSVNRWFVHRGVSKGWPGVTQATPVISSATAFDWLSASSEVGLFELFIEQRWNSNLNLILIFYLIFLFILFYYCVLLSLYYCVILFHQVSQASFLYLTLRLYFQMCCFFICMYPIKVQFLKTIKKKKKKKMEAVCYNYMVPVCDVTSRSIYFLD